jgi:hypothetical protein
MLPSARSIPRFNSFVSNSAVVFSRTDVADGGLTGVFRFSSTSFSIFIPKFSVFHSMTSDIASTIPLSKGEGMILSTEGFFTRLASASAAAILCSSVILVT